MERKRCTEQQIIGILKEVEGGKAVAEVARQYCVSAPIIFRWKKKYAGLSESKLKRMKSLEEENRRLKKIVAQQAMDNDVLRELLSKNW